MMMSLRCPTDLAIYLLFVYDENKVFRVYVEDGCLPGRMFWVDTKKPFVEQCVSMVKADVGSCFQWRHFVMEDDFFESFDLSKDCVSSAMMSRYKSSDQRSTLYVGTYKHLMKLDHSVWLMMPQLMRDFSFPQYKRHYFRAWQVAMGHLRQDSKVLLNEDFPN
ncbi:MAG: hypothetical protein OXC44_06320 [Proteobacteria bacterium]|nr:hypothetical protein [Pseudomonadota bacterium]